MDCAFATGEKMFAQWEGERRGDDGGVEEKEQRESIKPLGAIRRNVN